MNPLLQSFINESRDNLEQASRCLLALEAEAAAEATLDELFRAMHTIKGSAGLFEEYPVMPGLLHQLENLLDLARSHELQLDSDAIDLLLQALDLLADWLDQLEQTQQLPSDAEFRAADIKKRLKPYLEGDALPVSQPTEPTATAVTEEPPLSSETSAPSLKKPPALPKWTQSIPEEVRQQLVMHTWQQAASEEMAFLEADASAEQPEPLLLTFTPESNHFFSGSDPLHLVRNLQGLLWYGFAPNQAWPELDELDAFHSCLDFHCLVFAPRFSVQDQLRYVADELTWHDCTPESFIFPVGEQGEQDFYQPFVEQLPELLGEQNLIRLRKRLAPLMQISRGDLWQHSAVRWLDCLTQDSVIGADPLSPLQQTCLYTLGRSLLSGEYQWQAFVATTESGSAETRREAESSQQNLSQQRLKKELLQAQSLVLQAPLAEDQLFTGRLASVVRVIEQLAEANQLPELQTLAERCQQQAQVGPLVTWINQRVESLDRQLAAQQQVDEAAKASSQAQTASKQAASPSKPSSAAASEVATPRTQVSQSIRVEQKRIDELMTLAGELIVAKNALPFLQARVQEGANPEELTREIKLQYANIDRISERIQGAVMAARMLPFSNVFQRFPRLVRDLSRRMNKKVELKLKGEETQADKNILDNLADPLIHLLRNSLDHGLESPEERLEAGKPETGCITLSARALDDRVLVQIDDDGRGINVQALKRKAWQKGLIDEQQLEKMSHEQALQLILLPGLSTAESVSDVSGRGVGMDAVRSVIQESGGEITFSSEAGKGTRISILLPLSMAVARVMMVVIGDQKYGIPMSMIRETVRLPRSRIHEIKNRETITLRDQLIPLQRMRELLELPPAPEMEEEAILVVEVSGQPLGLVIDDFLQGIDLVQKPMEGIMAQYNFYSGSALMGDGQVLLILNLPVLLETHQAAGVTAELATDLAKE